MSVDSIEMPLKTKILRKQLELLAERSENCTTVEELVSLTDAMVQICRLEKPSTGQSIV